MFITPPVIFITLGQMSEVNVQLVMVVADESIVMIVQFRMMESSETEVIVQPSIFNSDCEFAKRKEERVEENELEKTNVSEVSVLFPCEEITAS